MSTLDEITKEKQRVGEALARVDAQRDKLIGELGELEAAERARALQQGHAGWKDGFGRRPDHINRGSRFSAVA